jgi:hypothetical protein
MLSTVQLHYFRPTGKFLTSVEAVLDLDELVEIWERVDELRRFGKLPGLVPGAGRDLHIVVDVPNHPKRVLHLVMPPFMDDDDVTPLRTPTGEMAPLIRIPLAEMPLPRTSTRDVVRVDAEADTVVLEDDETTPVEVPIPKPSDDQ